MLRSLLLSAVLFSFAKVASAEDVQITVETADPSLITEYGWYVNGEKYRTSDTPVFLQKDWSFPASDSHGFTASYEGLESIQYVTKIIIPNITGITLELSVSHLP